MRLARLRARRRSRRSARRRRRSRRPRRRSAPARPLAGEGISTSTLSVVTSAIVSSASTQSPGCLRHSSDRPLGDRDRPSSASRPCDRCWLSSARSSRQASFMSSSCGRTACSSGGLNGIGTSGAVSRRTGASRSSKRLGRDQRRDLGADPARLRRLVGDQHLAGLARAREDRVGVERAERAQVEDLDRPRRAPPPPRAPGGPPSRRRSRSSPRPRARRAPRRARPRARPRAPRP